MARTPAQTAALEKKALASDNKSEGMRSLFDAGYTVAQVKEVFGGPYGFAYGVASRWATTTGNPIPVDPRETKAATKSTAKAKTAAKPAAKAKAPAKAAAPVRSKAAIASAKRRAAAKAAKAK